jgi:hypothetical protein
VSLPGGIHVLPERDECREAFTWLAEEIHAAKGKAFLLRVDEFLGFSDAELVQMFHAERGQEYAGLGDLVRALEKQLESSQETDAVSLQEQLNRLVRRIMEIQASDYFQSPARAGVAARLARIQHLISPRQPLRPWLVRTTLDQYRDRRWVTRPKPFVDRLACAWFIRRFINPDAVIRYSDHSEPGEAAFDMAEGEFGHRGNLCTLEILLLSFGLDDPALHDISQIVHEIDLHDGKYQRPESAGIEEVLRGWSDLDLTDQELEARGNALFEGLYQAFQSRYHGSAL